METSRRHNGISNGPELRRRPAAEKMSQPPRPLREISGRGEQGEYQTVPLHEIEEVAGMDEHAGAVEEIHSEIFILGGQGDADHRRPSAFGLQQFGGDTGQGGTKYGEV